MFGYQARGMRDPMGMSPGNALSSFSPMAPQTMQSMQAAQMAEPVQTMQYGAPVPPSPQAPPQTIPGGTAPPPMSALSAWGFPRMPGAQNADFRQALMDWRGARPMWGREAPRPEDWRTQFNDWRSTRPDPRTFFQGS